MSVKTRVYDDEHGDPVVVMVTTGAFDVSRLVNLLSGGRSEDHIRAAKITRDVRRHQGGRAALKTLRDHGGPDLLQDVPPAPGELRERVAFAIAHPAAFVQRGCEVRGGERVHETVTHWGMRAVLATLAPWLDVTRRDTPERMLREFHAAGGWSLPSRPTTGIRPDLPALRQRLLDEEVQELRDAVAAGSLTGIADALAEFVYVAAGTAVTYGIPFDAVLAEVHRSNMTKFGPDGPVVQADGKVVKGPAYQPPDIARVLTPGNPLAEVTADA